MGRQLAAALRKRAKGQMLDPSELPVAPKQRLLMDEVGSSNPRRKERSRSSVQSSDGWGGES